MPRSPLAPLSAILLVLLPALASAQVRPAHVSGDCAQLKNCAPANATNHWSAYQVIGLNPLGVVNPRINVGLQIVGPGTGENNVVDAFSYNGSSQYVAERYDWNGHGFTALGKAENVGGFWGAAYDGKGDPVDAGLTFVTTEAQTTAFNGMDAELWYTPNGSTALTQGLAVSPGGLGGVTVGGGSGSW